MFRRATIDYHLVVFTSVHCTLPFIRSLPFGLEWFSNFHQSLLLFLLTSKSVLAWILVWNPTNFEPCVLGILQLKQQMPRYLFPRSLFIIVLLLSGVDNELIFETVSLLLWIKIPYFPAF